MAKKERKPIKIEITSIFFLIAMACVLLFEGITGLENETWSPLALILTEVVLLGYVFVNPARKFGVVYSFLTTAVFAFFAVMAALNVVTLVLTPETFAFAEAWEAYLPELNEEPTAFDKYTYMMTFFAPLTKNIASIIVNALLALTTVFLGLFAGGGAKKKAKIRMVPTVIAVVAFGVVAIADILMYGKTILVTPYPTTFFVIAEWAFYILFALGVHDFTTACFESTYGKD